MFTTISNIVNKGRCTLKEKNLENINKTNKHKDSLLFCTENKFGGEYLCTA